MEANMQTEGEISLLDVIKLLLRKWKLLVFVILIGAIAGSALGVMSTYNVHHFGTAVEFYVNPKRSSSSTENQSQYGVYGAYGKHVMDNMIKLLSSESFAEKLLLDENGLPTVGTLSEEKRSAALSAKEKADKAVAAVTRATEALEEATEAVTDAQKATNKAKTEYSDAQTAKNNALSAFQAVNQGTSIDQTIYNERYQALQAAEAKEASAKAAYDKAYAESEQATENKDAAKDALEEAEKAALAALDKSSEANEAALNEWRATEQHAKMLTVIQKSIAYSYLEDSVDTATANDLARSFIYVKLSVLNNEELAKFLLNRIKEEVPKYVEENMAVPSGYIGTNCQQITLLDSIRELNPDLMKNQALKYGLLLSVASFVVACAIIIIVDRSNKQLRDYEVIKKNFNLPVLGIIPSIESAELAAPSKKNGYQKTKTEGKRV